MMRRHLRIISFVTLLSCFSLATPAGMTQVVHPIGVEESSRGLTGGLSKTIFLDLRDINVVDVLKFLAIEGSLNIVTSRSVQGRSTLLLKNVTIRDALDIIVLSNQLAYQIRNNIIYVMSEDEYVELYGKNYNDQREVVTRTLHYAKPTYVVTALESLQSAVGKIIVDEEVGSVVLIDTPERLDAMLTLLNKIETELETEVVRLQYSKAVDLETQLQAKLDAKGVGSVFADSRSNQLVVSAYPGRMNEILDMIRELDREERAVLIDVRIMQITLSPRFDWGVDWRQILQDTGSGFLDSWDLDVSLPIDTGSGSGPATHLGQLTLGTLRDDYFESQIRALKQVERTNLISSPRLMVLNGQEAAINIVDTVPYVVTTSTGTGSNVTTSEDIRFVDIGVILKVTPTINDDGFVTIVVAPEISSRTGTLTTATGNAIPLVNKTTVTSTVVVKDGVTIVLGGLKSNQISKDTRGIPYLMEIPFIGNIFKSRDEDTKKQEIAIFITPKIVTGADPITDEPIEIKPLSDDARWAS
jgi:type II secretory pathway component GspD/PulD (secretin)